MREETQKQLNTELKTVWLSDDSLIKQIANRAGQFSVEAYTVLPDIYLPDEIKESKGNHFELYKTIGGKRYVAVIKVLEDAKEIYMQSFRRD